jgi:hypothetical protein
MADEPIDAVAGLLRESLAQVFHKRPSNPTLFIAQFIAERAALRDSDPDPSAEELPDAEPLIAESNKLTAQLREARSRNAGLGADLERALAALNASEVSLANEEAAAQRGVHKTHAAAVADISAAVRAGQRAVDEAAHEEAYAERRAEASVKSLQMHRIALEMLQTAEAGLDQHLAVAHA